MKLKLIITSIIISIIPFDGFCQVNGIFELSGQTTSEYDGYLYLKYANKIDSALVKNKSFFFKGKVDYPTEAVLLTKNETQSNFEFYLENNRTTLIVSIDNDVTIINSIKGNKTFQIFTDLHYFLQKNESDSDFSTKLYKKMDTVISQNPKNQFSGMILSDIILDPVFSYEQANSLFNKLDLSTQKNEYVNSIKESLLKLNKFKLGAVIKNFEFPNNKGELINTSNFKKRFLLIEFWASWCKPCREYNPDLVKIYKDYKKQGFEIYGVSLDHIEEDWIKAIKEDNLQWVNTIAKESWNNDIIKSLGIHVLPSNFLVDKDGKILALNIKPVELENFLKNE